MSRATQRILFFDCFSGLSGDMIVSALIDLGVPFSVVENAAAALPLSGYKIRHEKEVRSAVSVSRFFVDVDEAKQPHRHFSNIRDMINDSSLSDGIKTKSIAIFEVLAAAEAKVHGTTIEKVHFHEVGAVDSIVDIVGAAAGLEYLDVDVACAKIPLGRGFVKTQHGLLPLPAPATLNILEGVLVEGTDVEAELTTPTGAAVMKAMATQYGPMPTMRPLQTGFGAGSRSLPERPGILRVVLGEMESQTAARCMVLETNIDDMTGELAAHAMEQLLNNGALDVWFESIQMKKGRPALKMAVLCQPADRESLGALLMRETTTIGVRFYEVGRMEMQRSIAEAKTPWGTVRIKVSFSHAGMKTVSPEFEDCKQLALKNNVPLKNVMAAAIIGYSQHATVEPA